ncbi:MAG: cytochrome c3 family protein [bacterium]
MKTKDKFWKFSLLGLIILIALFALTYKHQNELLVKSAPIDPDHWGKSKKCQSCHKDEYQHWKKSWHRSMTQEVSAESVQGAFDGQTLDQWGVLVRPVMRNGSFYFQYLDKESGQLTNEYKVDRVVGSHRYQQYFTRQENSGNYYRLHYLWSNVDQRWIHLNGAFLGPDDQNYNAHITLWNQNCIFCHNTGAKPGIQNQAELLSKAAMGLKVDMVHESEYRSNVSELGIACDSCHGPSEQHNNINESSLRRWYLKISGDADKTIVNPKRLGAQESVDVCGQCHGQRIPHSSKQLQKWLLDGVDYRPGQKLQDSIYPVMPDTQVPGSQQTDLFKLRFWKDATPRLSAYEYQGVLQSKCFTQGRMTCESCHSMHEGNQEGMITTENLGNAPCLECHQNYESKLESHTHHKAGSKGSLCYNCHMPKIVYGVMEIHRSHRIENPVPNKNYDDKRPDACSQCHTSKPLQWFNQAMQKWWPDHAVKKQNFDSTSLPVFIESLLAGDAAQRAIAAREAGDIDLSPPLSQREELIPFLMLALADDYPAVRRFALHSLKGIVHQQVLLQEDGRLNKYINQYDAYVERPKRNQIVSQILAYWDSDLSKKYADFKNPLLKPDNQLDRNKITVLIKESKKHVAAIDIGE